MRSLRTRKLQFAATRESPHAAVKALHNQKKKKRRGGGGKGEKKVTGPSAELIAQHTSGVRNDLFLLCFQTHTNTCMLLELLYFQPPRGLGRKAWGAQAMQRGGQWTASQRLSSRGRPARSHDGRSREQDGHCPAWTPTGQKRKSGWAAA